MATHTGTQRELAEVQALFRSVFDQAPWGVALVGVDGRFRRVNAALCELTGFSKGEVVGRLVVETTHPEDRAQITHLLANTLAGSREAFDVESRLLGADGRAVWVRLRATLVRGASGQPCHSIHHIVDIGEQRAVTDAMARALERERAATDELRRLDADRCDFLAAVTHDFRAPLSSIVGFGSTLEDHWAQLTDEERCTFLRRIVLNGEELDRRIANFLEYSRLERGELTLECGPCDLRAVVDNAVERTQLMLERHTVDVSIPDDTTVIGEECALSRILENLLSNAAKYSPGGTAVTISAAVRRGRVLVSVDDDGPGVAVEDAERIFDPFYRATTGRGVGGAGIGLAGVRQLVRMMGGDVWVEPRPGGGSRFRVRLASAAEPSRRSYTRAR